MTHEEKNKLLKTFARGVENRNWEMLEQTRNCYNALDLLGYARDMKRSVYRDYQKSESVEEREKLEQTMHLLDEAQKQYKSQAEKAYQLALEAENEKGEEVDW